MVNEVNSGENFSWTNFMACTVDARPMSAHDVAILLAVPGSEIHIDGVQVFP
jgi:hypothetical protein